MNARQKLLCALAIFDIVLIGYLLWKVAELS